jgi:hypothetical protein|tara:strand:+ start:3245 stop:4036 length:792 start_codon:yes stop_codon:yes gene_type:complete
MGPQAAMAAVGVVTGVVGMFKAGRDKRNAEEDAFEMQQRIQELENSRQAIINPYSGIESLADMASDLSGELSNPMANLGVATMAAEIQMEQTDLALANTLDTLQATGASAGGATALAQAAARGKKDVAASIEAQEAANEKLRAQGQQRLQEQQLAEKRRIQGINISEGQRVQDAGVKGNIFEFEKQEARDIMSLDRLAGQEAQARQDVASANAAFSGALGSITGGVTGFLGSKPGNDEDEDGGGGGGQKDYKALFNSYRGKLV